MDTTPPRASPPNLAALQAFTCVARHLNFARAASDLGVTPTAMSKTVKTLEARLGVRLFNRTTRSVSLTEHGSQLLGLLTPALDLIERSVQQVGEEASRPGGLLRINTSYVAFASLIQPHQAEFMARYPDLRLEFALDDKLVDVVGSGFDAGIRPGRSVQRDMIAVPLGGPQQRVVVASPAYLERHGAPTAPLDLLTHDCIRQRFPQGRFFEWRFAARDKSFVIDVAGRLVYGEMRCVLDAARQGLGLGYVYRRFADEHLRSGQLLALLERHCVATEGFHLYYPNRGQMPGKLRAFIEFMQAANRESGRRGGTVAPEDR